MTLSLNRASESPDIHDWTRKLVRIWKPAHLLSTRPRATGGVLFIAELTSGLLLHLGVQEEGIDMCALWQGEECVLWDSLIGFCSTLEANPNSREQHALATQMKSLVRRNCFALGCEMEATEDEKRDWRVWMGQQPNPA